MTSCPQFTFGLNNIAPLYYGSGVAIKIGISSVNLFRSRIFGVLSESFGACVA